MYPSFLIEWYDIQNTFTRGVRKGTSSSMVIWQGVNGLKCCRGGYVWNRCCFIGFLLGYVGEGVVKLLISGNCATRCPYSSLFQSVYVEDSN